MILGITGTDGAGKGTVVEWLIREKGFTHYSSRATIMKEVVAQGLEPTRNQLRLTANEMRAREGDDVLVSRALHAMQADGVTQAVIESIRALAEMRTLKTVDGILLAVDADPAIRYARVQKRRSSSDQVSLEEFLAHEELEKNDPDPHGMQKAAVLAEADFVFMNNGTPEELFAQVEAFCAARGL